MLVEPVSGHYFATSDRTSTVVHHVTGYSCTCLVFTRFGRCMHRAALLVGMGWLPMLEFPAGGSDPAFSPFRDDTVPAKAPSLYESTSATVTAVTPTEETTADDARPPDVRGRELVVCPICAGTGAVWRGSVPEDVG